MRTQAPLVGPSRVTFSVALIGSGAADNFSCSHAHHYKEPEKGKTKQSRDAPFRHLIHAIVSVCLSAGVIQVDREDADAEERQKRGV